MANYQLLKADIDKKVYQNGEQEITGANLNAVLNAMVTTLGAGYQFAGVATTATNPGTPDAKVFYIANGKGTYTNFGGVEVTEDDVVVLYWDTAWHKEATGIASQEKLTELEKKIVDKDFFEDGISGKYIGVDGGLESLSSAITTEYIKVSEGDSLHFKGGFQDSGAEALGLVWGYADAEGNGAVKLVNSYSLYDDDFIIPQGVNYIRAWSLIDKNPSISFNGTIERFVSENQPKIDYAYNFAKENSPSVVTITATRNAEDYNSIRDLLDSITDASESNRYQIIIPRGRWFESDLRGKKWVELIGEDREESILYCDGTSDKITPPNYAYGDYSNMPLNTIPSIYKHVFFVTEDLNISNLTIEAKSCKYCIHPDSAYFDSVSVKNCHLIGDSLNAIVGIGLHGGQEIVFDSCIFEDKGWGLGIYCHNWNNQSKGSSLTIQNSLFNNVTFISLGELGSEQVDRINLINNVFGANVTKNIGIRVETNAAGASFWKNPNTGENETNLDNVPYCLYVNTCGTSISKINATNRDKFKDSYFIGNTSEL